MVNLGQGSITFWLLTFARGALNNCCSFFLPFIRPKVILIAGIVLTRAKLFIEFLLPLLMIILSFEILLYFCEPYARELDAFSRGSITHLVKAA